MRKLLLMLTVALPISSLCGCSGETPSNQPSPKAVVKKSIVKPRPERLQVESLALVEKNAQKGSAAPSPAAEKKVEAEGKQSEVTGEPVQKPEAGRSLATPELRPGPEETKGFYEAKNGDTLATIAGKQEVFGDHLKWPILYRLNAQALASLPAADRLPDLPLADGIRLRIFSPEEVSRNLEKRSGNHWVVNVLSATTNAELIPAVIGLIKNDYPVYVASARVNEKNWMRVRVGFFRTRKQAESEGKRIMELLSLRDTWVTRLPKAEFAEYAGY